MKSARVVPSPAALAAALACTVVLGLAARADSSAGSTLAATFPPVVPLHHRQIYFTYALNSNACVSDPTQGFYITIQLNPSTGGNNNCPETLCLPSWINCGPGGDIESPQAGVANGNMRVRQLPAGWISYRFEFQIQNAFTQIWDAAQPPGGHKVAVGYSKFTGQVYYERNQTIPQDANYSVLGPIAHAFQYTALIRNFAFHVQVQGKGDSLRLPGQSARWTLGAQFKTKNDLALGQFNLSP